MIGITSNTKMAIWPPNGAKIYNQKVKRVLNKYNINPISENHGDSWEFNSTKLSYSELSSIIKAF